MIIRNRLKEPRLTAYLVNCHETVEGHTIITTPPHRPQMIRDLQAWNRNLEQILS